MLNQSTAYGALLLRLSLAAMWWAHGLLKWQGFTLPGTAAFFESVGLPGAFAYLVFSAEMIAGALLLIETDGPTPAEVLEKITALEQVITAVPMKF